MQTKYPISQIERNLIISFSFVAFALFAIGIFGEAVESYNNSVVEYQNELARQAGARNIISFSACGGFYFYIALFNLILMPIFLSLIRPGKYILSTSLTIIYGVLLIVSVVFRLDGRGGLGTENFFTDPWYELWMKTSINDYIALFVIVVLLIWQSSILWRMNIGREGSDGLR